MDASFPVISKQDTGSILNRFSQDLMFVDLQLPMALFNTASGLFIGVVQIILVATASVYALYMAPVLFVVVYIVQRVYLRTSKQLRLLELDAKGVLHTNIAESSGGLGTIRAHDWTEPVTRKFLVNLDKSQKPVYLLSAVERWLQLVMNLVVAGLVTVVLGVCVALKSKNAIAAGSVGVAFLNVVTLGETLTNLVMSYTSLQTSMGAIHRIVSFEKDSPSERSEEICKQALQTAEVTPSETLLESDVALRLSNVWATYNTVSQEPEHTAWALRGVDLNIHRGQHVTICGTTGSGKSTLHLALLRMVNIPIGLVAVNGIDHDQMPLEILRQKFCVISQDAVAWGGTLRDELGLQGRLSSDELNTILQDCRLLDVVDRQGGLDTPYQNCTFSEGEAQLLNVARVIGQTKDIDDAKIVLLDEVTSR